MISILITKYGQYSKNVSQLLKHGFPEETLPLSNSRAAIKAHETAVNKRDNESSHRLQEKINKLNRDNQLKPAKVARHSNANK